MLEVGWAKGWKGLGVRWFRSNGIFVNEEPAFPVSTTFGVEIWFGVHQAGTIEGGVSNHTYIHTYIYMWCIESESLRSTGIWTSYQMLA